MRKFFKKIIDVFVLLKSKNYIIYIPKSENGNAGQLEKISNIHVITYDIDMSLIYNIWKWHLYFLTGGTVELHLVDKKTKTKTGKNRS